MFTISEKMYQAAIEMLAEGYEVDRATNLEAKLMNCIVNERTNLIVLTAAMLCVIYKAARSTEVVAELPRLPTNLERKEFMLALMAILIDSFDANWTDADEETRH